MNFTPKTIDFTPKTMEYAPKNDRLRTEDEECVVPQPVLLQCRGDCKFIICNTNFTICDTESIILNKEFGILEDNSAVLMQTAPLPAATSRAATMPLRFRRCATANEHIDSGSLEFGMPFPHGPVPTSTFRKGSEHKIIMFYYKIHHSSRQNRRFFQQNRRFLCFPAQIHTNVLQWRLVWPEFIILNTKFLVSNTEFLVLNTKFIIFTGLVQPVPAKFIILNTFYIKKNFLFLIHPSRFDAQFLILNIHFALRVRRCQFVPNVHCLIRQVPAIIQEIYQSLACIYTAGIT